MNEDKWQLRVTAGSTLATSVPSAGVGGSACVRTTIKHDGFLSFRARQPGMFQHASALDMWVRRVLPAAEAPVNVRFQLLQVKTPALSLHHCLSRLSDVYDHLGVDVVKVNGTETSHDSVPYVLSDEALSKASGMAGWQHVSIPLTAFHNPDLSVASFPAQTAAWNELRVRRPSTPLHSTPLAVDCA